MELLKPKPAYVTFEVRAVEDRAASIAAGAPRFKDVDYAFVTPAGSRDRIERIVEEWLPQLADQVKMGLLPEEWAQAYRRAYEAFKAGKEAPVDGTDLRNWPNVTPSQLKTLIGLNVRTVEELAVANEETLHRMGMGARALKDKAIEYLSLAAGHGRTVEEIVALKVENETLRQQQAADHEKLAALEQTIAGLQAAMARIIAAGQSAPAETIDSDDLVS